MATENQNVVELTRAIKELTRAMTSNGNSSASVVGQSGKYSDNDTNQPFDLDGSKDVKTSMDALAKATKKASESVGDEMKERIKDAKVGFSEIAKRIGGSVINSMPFRSNKKILQQGIKNLNNELSTASKGIQQELGSILTSAAKAHKMSTRDFLKDTGSLNESFSKLSKISLKLAKEGSISEAEMGDFNTTLAKMKDSGINVTKMLGGAGSAFDKVSKVIEKDATNKNKVLWIGKRNIKEAANDIHNAGEAFSKSALKFANTVDNGLTAKFEALGKAADDAGENLKTSLKVAIPLAFHRLHEGLTANTKAGFRGTDVVDASKLAIKFGQSQSELATSLKTFRTALRVGSNNPDIMKAIKNGAFDDTYNDIQSKLSLTGKENTDLMGKSMDTLMNFGIKPTMEESKHFRDMLQETGSMGDKGPQEILDVFANLSKDKGFKMFFNSINTGGRGLDKLFKSFSKLQGQVGLTVDEFVTLQQGYAGQRNRQGATAIVEGAFAGILGGKLGYGKEQQDLLRRGGISRASLNEEDGKAYDELILKERGKLTRLITTYMTQGIEGQRKLQRLQPIMEKAGIAGQQLVSQVNAENAGKQQFFDKNGKAIKDIGNKATNPVEQGITRIVSIMEGWAKSPMGITVGAFAAPLLSALAGGLIGGAIGGGKGGPIARLMKMLNNKPISGVASTSTLGAEAKAATSSMKVGKLKAIGQKLPYLLPILTAMEGINTGRKSVSAGDSSTDVSRKTGESLLKGATSGLALYNPVGLAAVISDTLLGTNFIESVTSGIGSGIDAAGPTIRNTLSRSIESIFNIFKSEDTRTDLEKTIDMMKNGQYTPDATTRNEILAKQAAINMRESDTKAYKKSVTDYMYTGVFPKNDPSKITDREYKARAIAEVEHAQQTADEIAEGFKMMIELLGKGNEINEDIAKKTGKKVTNSGESLVKSTINT